MPTIAVTHDITKGTDHWLSSTKRQEASGPLGITNIRTFVSAEDPTKVCVLMDVPDMDALMGAMQRGDANEAMASDGVVAESLKIYVEASA